MPKTLQLAVDLPAPPEQLYAMYLDAAQHAAFTGAPVIVSSEPGAPFSAFDGVLTGTMLQTIPNRLIVQAWRSANWDATDLDSTLVLHFLPGPGGTGRIELTHVNVPESDFAGVSQGWEKFYWAPWREYLASKT